MFKNSLSKKVLSVLVFMFFSVVMLTAMGEDAFSKPVPNKCKKIQGTSSGVVFSCADSGITNGCLDGNVNGSLQGSISLRLSSPALAFHADANVGVFAGDTVITTADGVLFGIETLTIDFDGNTTDFIVWDGGTGIFVGAFGFAQLTGTSDLVSIKKTFQAEWAGEICLP